MVHHRCLKYHFKDAIVNNGLVPLRSGQVIVTRFCPYRPSKIATSCYNDGKPILIYDLTLLQIKAGWLKRADWLLSNMIVTPTLHPLVLGI